MIDLLDSVTRRLVLISTVELNITMTTWDNYVAFAKAKADGNIDEVLITSPDGTTLASSSSNFYLRQYSTLIVQEDGSEKEQLVNEADNILLALSRSKPFPQGIRINGGKKHQIVRQDEDEITRLSRIHTRYLGGGSCIVNAGQCIVIGCYNDKKGQISTACSEVVVQIARYLATSAWPTTSHVATIQPLSRGENNGDIKEEELQSSTTSSWDSIIDKALLGKGNVAFAMVCTVDGTVLATHPSSFQLKRYDSLIMQEDGSESLQPVDETKNLLQLLKDIRTVQGLRLCETKYQIVKSFQEGKCFYIYGKKTRGGCCIAATASIIIVCTYDETKGHSCPGCNATVSALISYLQK